jgi:magnesium-transporting ATPase (P-type)
LIQIPILLICTSLVWFKVHIPLKDSQQSIRQKLARIDFLGSFTLVITVSSLLLAMTLKTSAETELGWSDPRVWGLLVVSAVVGLIFVYVEGNLVKEPIMPLRLMR